jgi:hypothetical protein
VRRKKPHPIVNKLLWSVRHSKMWMPKKILNKKKEAKKRGYES